MQMHIAIRKVQNREEGENLNLNTEKLKICLARKGFNATDLKITGVAYNTILRALHGKGIQSKTAGKIAKALDVDVAEIMAEEVD